MMTKAIYNRFEQNNVPTGRVEAWTAKQHQLEAKITKAMAAKGAPTNGDTE